MADITAATDLTTINDIDRAIQHCQNTTDLNPAIREAFINALLDKRNRLGGSDG